jgi:hypothetical protein
MNLKIQDKQTASTVAFFFFFIYNVNSKKSSIITCFLDFYDILIEKGAVVSMFKT